MGYQYTIKAAVESLGVAGSNAVTFCDRMWKVTQNVCHSSSQSSDWNGNQQVSYEQLEQNLDEIAAHEAEPHVHVLYASQLR